MAGYALAKISATDAVKRGGSLVDVRKAAARTASGQQVRGAQWIDPFALSHGHDVLNQTDLIFYCVHGHEVSQFACALARIHGVDAAYVEGGFEALVAAGAALESAE